MAAMETLSQAMTRLVNDGYIEDFQAVDAQLACGECGSRFDPAAMTVDEVVRFEGMSDPGDQAILYALSAGCGHRGLYASPYGATASRDDIAVQLALPDA